MLEFVKNAFRGFFGFILWIIMIGSVVGGGIAGYVIGEVGGAFVGILLGGIVGLITIILTGGLVAVLLNMDKKLEDIAGKVS